MEWSAFRSGRALAVDAETRVTYSDLELAGFAPYYAKVVFTMLEAGAADAATLARWLDAARDPKRFAAVKDELQRDAEASADAADGTRGGPDGPATARGSRTSSTRAPRSRKRRERRYPLVARGGSLRHARLEAERIGLEPVETRHGDPASGEVRVRLDVEATKDQATVLTLSGFWMHRPKDDTTPATPAPRARVRKPRP